MGSPKKIGPPDADAAVVEVVGRRRCWKYCEECGVTDGEILEGGRVSQDRVRRQEARRIENEVEDIGSWVEV